MDSKINAVLETYHGWIAREHEDQCPAEGRKDMLLAVGPETGRLLNILAKSLKSPTILELGTSFGYSGIWLAEAARATGGRLITMEKYDYKSSFAHDMAAKAGLAGHIDFRVGDAVQMIEEIDEAIDFVLVDLWKDLYVPCLRAFLPKLKPGAILVADNISPDRDNTRPYVEAVRAVPGMASVTLPVGQGIEISRFQAA